MTWRRVFGPEPISPESERSDFARVVLAAAVAAPLDAIEGNEVDNIT
jgi:hypothetical protein